MKAAYKKYKHRCYFVYNKDNGKIFVDKETGIQAIYTTKTKAKDLRDFINNNLQGKNNGK